jgi:hypothetical protein
MREHNINFFVEDDGHEKFLAPMVQRFANQYGILVKIKIGNSTGGRGKVISELKRYIRDLERGKESLPDLLIVAIDGNNEGYSIRKKEIDDATKNFSGATIYAIPEPHVERWLLLDSKAFKNVLGKGCNAPDRKFDRDRYKRLLLEAVRNTDRIPILGGMEYAEELVNAMDLEYLEKTEESLGKLLKALRDKFKEWERSEHTAPQETPGSQSPDSDNPQA